MNATIVAIALDDAGQIAQHAGRASLWQMYAVEDKRAELVWTLASTAAASLHEWHVRGDGNRHPLHNADIAIAGSAGDGVIRNLAQLVTTTETAPQKAIDAFIKGSLSNENTHQEETCINH